MAPSLRLLIVEDLEDDALLVLREFRRAGYNVTFERVDTPESMAAALANPPWDLVVADYTMPHFSGIAALEQLKQSGIDIPFIVVSGSIGEDKAVATMKAGAHDYIMKGNLQRLIASVERELREAEVRRERKHAVEAVKQNLERLKALHEINLAIISTLDLQAVLQILLEKIGLLLPYCAMTVRLFNHETGELEPVACRNINEQEWKANRKGVQGLAKIALENKIPVTVSDIQTDPRAAASDFARKQGLVSYLGIPLIAKDEVLGLIVFYTKERRSFSDDEIEFLTTLAGQAAIAIHNARLYEQIKKQMVELEKSNKVKDEFLNVMSHELRTPLNVTMGYTGLVRDGSLGEINAEQEMALGKAMSHANDLLKMVNSILYATSLEAEAIGVNAGEVDLRNLLEELKTDYAIPSDKKLSVVWDFPYDLPVIRTDHAKLKHVLENLLNNAIKFTDRGRVALNARHVPETNTLEFQISDTGVGIPKEKLPVIFEMFRQIDSSQTRPYGGVGLGLFIVKKFTEMLGGTVRVESEPGKGSTFTIRIPCQVTTPQIHRARPAAPVEKHQGNRLTGKF
ncbi:MAG TPA: ATP-binding protein [Candidatus Binatia bacterium]|nr:ATP-binding protein [Candidatus Binatia bacterium]